MKKDRPFLNEYFRKLRKGNAVTFPKDWVRPKFLSVIPFRLSSLSLDFFEKSQDLKFQGLSLQQAWRQCLVTSNCLVGFYERDLSQIRMSWYVGKAVPLKGSKQTFEVEDNRELLLSQTLVDHLGSNSNNNTEKVYFNPMGEHFVLWDSDYYMDDPILKNTISIYHAIEIMKRNVRSGAPLNARPRFL